MIYLPSHTWACTLIVIPIERPFQNKEEFLKFVKQMINADTGKDRFKHIKSNYQLSKRFSSFSVEHRLRATDMWPTSKYGRPVFLNVHGYAFVHPKKPNYLVDIVYSERWFEKNFTSDIEKIGQEFIDNLIIEDEEVPAPVSVDLQQEKGAVSVYSDHETHAQLGNRYLAEKLFTEAIFEYKKFLKDNPNDAVVNYNLGYSYSELGEHKKAINYLQKAAQLNNQDHDTYARLGFSYDQLGRYEEAIENYKKALAVNPDDAVDYYNIGVAYTYLKNYGEAIKYYEMALQRNPDYVDVYNNIGFVHAELGQHEQAIQYYEKVLQINPDDAYGHNNLGFAYANLGQYEKAIQYYEKALELNRFYEVARNNLKDAQRKLGK